MKPILLKVGMLVGIGTLLLTHVSAREMELPKRGTVKIATKSTPKTDATPQTPQKSVSVESPKKTEGSSVESKTSAGDHLDNEWRHGKDPTKRKERLLAKFDANKDGSLNSDEIDEMLKHHSKSKGDRPHHDRSAMKQAMLEKYDANHNGKLDDDEKAKMKADRMAKIDTNHDGKIDDAERKAAHEARRKERVPKA